MSVGILIKFKTPDREDLYLPVAVQGVYRNEWMDTAKRLGLRWLPLFYAGAPVDVRDLPAVVDEIRRVRDALAGVPGKGHIVERIDYILEELDHVDADGVAEIFIG